MSSSGLRYSLRKGCVKSSFSKSPRRRRSETLRVRRTCCSGGFELRSAGREVKSVRKRNCRFARRHIEDGFIVEACDERTA